MSMIRFSAEASLYKASGHYRTGRQALYLPRRTNSMRLALDEGEVIVIKDCPPGWEKLGEGVCVPKHSLPGGGVPPGTPEEPSGEGPHGPGGGWPGDVPGEEHGTPSRAEKTGKAWRVQCEKEQKDPIKVLDCCVKRTDKCMKEAQGNEGREMQCASASCWCLQQPGCV